MTSRRVQKETRYDPIITLLVDRIKALKRYTKYMEEAKSKGIKTVRDYSLMFFAFYFLERE